ncbi:hypothetical protein AC579_2738 [Pseudocercospora musae]|uniref:Uncharacterized protein n=1 Tax=Pseudocercospora musae TaxID=113226 RepID=A0A139I7W0_9PEZI|nr:hypothetical protein AC579_2738 [Pseudocercospora musae]
MKHFGILTGLAAIAAAAPYPTAAIYPMPTGALPPRPPPGSGIAAPTGLPHSSGAFPPLPSGGFPGFPNGTHPPHPPHPSGYGHHPPHPPFGTAPPKPASGTAPAKRAAQFGDLSSPSISLPTGGFGGGSGIAAPTGLGSGADLEGGLGDFGGISGGAAPTGLGGGSGDAPSLSLPTGSFGAGSALPTGLSGFGRYEGRERGVAAASGGLPIPPSPGVAGPSAGLPQLTGGPSVGGGDAPEPPIPTAAVGRNGPAESGVATPTEAVAERGFGSVAVKTRLAGQA